MDERKKQMKKSLIKRELLPMNLQLFAEEGAGDPPAENDAAKDDAAAGETEDKPFAAPASQSELDSIIGKAVNTALANAKKKSQKEIDDAIQEALKKEKDYSKLSESERKEKEIDDREQALTDREAQADYKELLAQVATDLASKKLPGEFAEMLAVQGDNEKSLNNVKQFEKTFNEAVAEQVKVSLRQKTPGFSGGSTSSTNYGAQVAKKTGAAPSGTLF